MMNCIENKSTRNIFPQNKKFCLNFQNSRAISSMRLKPVFNEG